MTCPDCGSRENGVAKVRYYDDRVYRRRECHDCGARWTTYERAEEAPTGRPPEPRDGR